jgi:hypothetical protein
MSATHLVRGNRWKPGKHNEIHATCTYRTTTTSIGPNGRVRVLESNILHELGTKIVIVYLTA